MSKTPYVSQISRTRAKYPSGGVKQPPAFCTGSRMTAATVPGPSNSMRSARASANARGVESLRRAVDIRVEDVRAARDERLERLPQPREPGCGERAQRGAVVRRLARDELGLRGRAGEAVVLPSQLDRALNRLRAARREEHALEAFGRETGHPFGQLGGLRMDVRPGVEEAELGRLVGTRLGDVGSAVADVDAEQRGEPVEVPAALRVVHVAPLAANDDGEVRRSERREAHPEVSPRGGADLLAVGDGVGRGHGCKRASPGLTATDRPQTNGRRALG